MDLDVDPEFNDFGQDNGADNSWYEKEIEKEESD